MSLIMMKRKQAVFLFVFAVYPCKFIFFSFFFSVNEAVGKDGIVELVHIYIIFNY